MANADRDVRMFWGMPMRWNGKMMFTNFWNREDKRVFPPKQFGIGWDLNFHALFRQMGLIRKPRKPRKRAR